MSRLSFRTFLHRLGAPALMLSIAALVAGTVALPHSSAAPGDTVPDRPGAEDKNSTKVSSVQALADKQKKMGERFQRFETVLLRLAELTAKSDPRRSALLKKAVAQSKHELIGLQFERISELMAKERLGDSVTRQGELKQDLEKLLELLVGDSTTDNRRKELGEYLKWLNDRIKEETEIQGRTANGGDPKRIAGDQGKTADKTGQLAKAMKAADDARKGKAGDAKAGDPKAGDAKAGDPKAGDPKGGDSKPGKEGKGGDPKGGDGQPGPGDKHDHDHDTPDDDETPGRKRIAAAEEKMRKAQAELEKARRENALEEQEKAIDDLKVAKAEIEEILRQLREEEIERILAMLEVRFRKMLEMQIAVYEGTLLLDRIPADDRGRNHEVESSRLSRRESQMVVDCNKALAILKEEGSGVALPMALEQVRDDMESVVIRLAQDKVDPITQSVEEDIIAALEHLIDALQKAQKEKDDDDKDPEGPDGPTGPRPDPPLVDKLAELKMIRLMQLQVNDRTRRFSKLVEDEQADKPALLEALDKLSDREQKIQRSTKQISLGKNR